VVEVVVLASLVSLGVVSLVRCLEVAIEDWEVAQRIADLRRHVGLGRQGPSLELAGRGEGVAAIATALVMPGAGKSESNA
jgi:hypothetical protein